MFKIEHSVYRQIESNEVESVSSQSFKLTTTVKRGCSKTSENLGWIRQFE